MKTILIVEDDPDILFAVSMLLEGEGYATQKAENGSVALEILKNHGLPHLVLLDMMMPIMNGWQFGLAFREMYPERTPVVVMSAAADAEQRAQDIGAEGWIGKPFMLDELLPVIKRFEKP